MAPGDVAPTRLDRPPQPAGPGGVAVLEPEVLEPEVLEPEVLEPEVVEPEVVDQDDDEIGFALSCQDGFPPHSAREARACRNHASGRS